MAELSQLPDVVDLKFVAGDTFRIRIRVVDPSTTEPMPLTDYAFAAEIMDQARNVVATFEVTPDTEDPTHSVILTLPPGETKMLPTVSDGGTGSEFTGAWDLEVIFPNDDVRTVAKGTVRCYIDVTNTGDG